jgi:ATP-dependent exoDNAse (exonuclease V) beta subunit
VFFELASLPPATKESRDRERVRELTRLLYVTLTRARRGLIIPWGAGFGGTQREQPSFAQLWGADPAAIDELTGESRLGAEAAIPDVKPRRQTAAAEPPTVPTPGKLPGRVLPHQLARGADAIRAARHELAADEPLVAGGGDDPIPYGLWWHETMEALPWTADDATVTDYGERALQQAASQGFLARAKEEWMRLRASAAWTVLRAARWTRLAEIGIFAPLRAEAWIDGVIDLVLRDAAAGEIWVLDWKTNRRRQGETDTALLARLVEEYRPQLSAYGECLEGFFPRCRVRRLVFSSVVGAWSDTEPEKF